jgi:TRAP-type C4-dicarboxylate transport system permease small subunit
MNMKRKNNLKQIVLLLQRFLNSIDILTQLIEILALVVITITVFLGVLSRYVFTNPIVWTVEISRFLFIWITLLGISITERNEAHFRVTAFVDFLPQKTQVFVNLLADLIVIIILIILFFISLLYVQQGSRGLSPVLELPLNYFYISLPIGVVLALFPRLRKTCNSFLKIKNFNKSEVKNKQTIDLKGIEHSNTGES